MSGDGGIGGDGGSIGTGLGGLIGGLSGIPGGSALAVLSVGKLALTGLVVIHPVGGLALGLDLVMVTWEKWARQLVEGLVASVVLMGVVLLMMVNIIRLSSAGSSYNQDQIWPCILAGTQAADQ